MSNKPVFVMVPSSTLDSKEDIFKENDFIQCPSEILGLDGGDQCHLLLHASPSLEESLVIGDLHLVAGVLDLSLPVQPCIAVNLDSEAIDNLVLNLRRNGNDWEGVVCKSEENPWGKE